MISGNENAKNILINYFESIKNGKMVSNFLLLDGPESVGKTTLIKELVKQLIGNNFNNDFLYVPDLSWYMGKKHTLKVDVDEKEQKISIPDVGDFMDLGARQILEWLQKSSLGKYKIILLENIDRMTNSAANALLKTFEEPMFGKIIIATTSNSNSILETILSRAFIIKFTVPDFDLVKDSLKQKYPNISEHELNSIVSFSMGRIGFAIRLIEKMPAHMFKDFGDVVFLFEKFIKLNQTTGNYYEKMEILKNVDKMGVLNMFFDALIFYYTKENYFENVKKIFQAKSMITANLSVENALFNMIL